MPNKPQNEFARLPIGRPPQNGPTRQYTRLEISLTPEQRDKLRAYAEARGVSMSEAVRQWIKRLPE